MLLFDSCCAQGYVGFLIPSTLFVEIADPSAARVSLPIPFALVFEEKSKCCNFHEKKNIGKIWINGV